MTIRKNIALGPTGLGQYFPVLSLPLGLGGVIRIHYDPKEMPDDRAKQIVKKRQSNDSKSGGQSSSRMWGKRHPELGGNRVFKRSYRERLDRPFSFDQDEEGPFV